MEKIAANTHIMGRSLYFAALPLWHLRRHSPLRVRGIILNEQNEILLVKNWFGPGTWELPGGAIEPFETAQQALIRELYEELGLSIPHQLLQTCGSLTHAKRLASYQAQCFVIKLEQPKLRLSGEVYKSWWTDKKTVVKQVPYAARLLSKV